MTAPIRRSATKPSPHPPKHYYDADNDGTVAAMGSGQEPFFLDTIGPDSDRRGTVVFDVPRSVLGQKVEVRFNELGFGSTHGYIRLPSRIAS